MADFKVAIISYNPNEPPLLVLVVAEIARTPLDKKIKLLAKPSAKVPELTVNSATTDKFSGGDTIARFLARAITFSGATLYGADAVEATQVDALLDYARIVHLADPAALGVHLAQVNTHLESRTYLVGQGNRVTIADFALFEALREHKGWQPESDNLEKNYPHLWRWIEHIENLPEVQKVYEATKQVREKNEKLKEASKTGSYKIDLPGAEMGKVVTRFPPEPSGYLHIGHAKAALLNYTIANDWKGKMILRFDDTNPAAEKEEFVENILKDLKTLGVTYDMLTHTSDHFDTILKYGEQLLRDGNGYIDDTPVDQMRADRKAGVESRCRANSLEDNLRMWNEMLKGSEQGCKCVLRGKIDMQAENKTMRDPTFFRCNLTPHHRTGSKYKCYPTYDFACPIVDSIEGVTHALRTIEYHDRNAQFDWVVHALKLRPVCIWDYSRLNFKYTLLSKRKLKWFVDEKKVEGWNDPRFPTVQGIMRRGLTVDGLRAFIKSQGASRTNNLMEWDKIWSDNQKVIDPIAPRYTAIVKDGKVEFKLAGSPKKELKIALHPKNAAVGDKKVVVGPVIYIDHEDAKLLADGEEVTLINWGNAFADKIHRNKDGSIASIEGRLNLQGNVKATDKKITWLSAQDKAIPLVLVEFDHLITAPKIEEEDDFKQFLTPKTRFETAALGEAALANLKKGDIIQLTRRGFFICDQEHNAAKNQPAVLFFIPDGKMKSMSTLSSKVERRK